MSVTLEQTTEAAFPDRGTTGLRVTAAAGNAGAYVEVNLAAAESNLHVRVMLHPGTLTGGRLVFLRGARGEGAEAFRLTLDPAAGELTLRCFAETTLVAPLGHGPAWRCVEVRVDDAAGVGELWLDGRRRAAATWPPLDRTTAQLRLGGYQKDTAAAGWIALDEWFIADGYIGPVRVEPTSPHADDPRRWLVLYSRDAAESAAWADHYRQHRSVPHANLLGLPLAATETIDEAAFLALREAVGQYLDAHGLGEQVMGVLCGFGVPGYVLRDDGERLALPALLQRLNGALAPADNPWFDEPIATRPRAGDHPAERMTARLDAPSLAEAIDLIDRTLAAEQGDAVTGALWLDAAGAAGHDPTLATALADWGAGLGRQALRLSLVLADPADPDPPSFASVVNDALFWGGWEQGGEAVSFGEATPGRLFAAGLDPTAATGPTLRDSSDGGWLGRAMAGGYLSAAASAGAVGVEALPAIDRFFAALRAGWTVGEAWTLALPRSGSPLFLAGDPLFRPPLPRAGWDLFGPFAGWDDARFDEPIAMLREDERTLPLPPDLRPAEGEAAIYVLRHLDAAGRVEAGLTQVRVTSIDGVAVALPDAAAWPGEADWPVALDGETARIEAIWARPFGIAGVQRLELWQHPDGAEAVLVEAASVSPRASRHRFDVELAPDTPTRFQVRAVGSGGGTRASPWSRPAAVTATAPTTPLHSLEPGL